MSAAECGVGAIKSLAIEYERDQQVRAEVARGRPSIRGAADAGAALSSEDQQLMRSFFEPAPGLGPGVGVSGPPGRGKAAAPAPAAWGPRRALALRGAAADPRASADWADEFHRASPLAGQPGGLAAAWHAAAPVAHPHATDSAFAAEFARISLNQAGMGLVGPSGYAGGAWSGMAPFRGLEMPMAPAALDSQQLDSQQLDREFASAFEAAAASVSKPEQAEQPQAPTLTDARLEQAWTTAGAEAAAPPLQELDDAAWEAMLAAGTGTGAGAAVDLDGLEERFNEAWKGERASPVPVDPLQGPLAEYTFEAQNPYSELQDDPYAEGLRLLRERGPLGQTALAFEAAVQRFQQRGDASLELEAWGWLGLVQAENEKEQAAIAALQRAVRGDPQNARALLALAASLTNEGADLQAYGALERWIHLQYPQLHKDAPRQWEGGVRTGDHDAYQTNVTRKFLAAARAGPGLSAAAAPRDREAGVDADVQVGLGILFYNAGSYDKAVDCFQAAARVRPDDHLVWNRLGATLANSGRSEEAISAYRHALRIKPTFVRGLYNLGVSCMNIGCYREAAEHFLAAISMHQDPLRAVEASAAVREQAQAAGATTASDTLWEILRRTLILMDRRDLAALADGSRSVGVFRREFEF